MVLRLKVSGKLTNLAAYGRLEVVNGELDAVFSMTFRYSAPSRAAYIRNSWHMVPSYSSDRPLSKVAALHPPIIQVVQDSEIPMISRVTAPNLRL